jgi:hypothetical protein
MSTFKATTFRLNNSTQYADQLWLKSLGAIATSSTDGETEAFKAAYLDDGNLAVPSVFGSMSWGMPVEGSSRVEPSRCTIKLFEGEDMVPAATFEPFVATFPGTVSAAELQGTLTTASQTSVTSLGTLSGLTVDGRVFLPSVESVPSAGSYLAWDASTGEVLVTPSTGAYQEIDTLPILTISEDLRLPNARTFRTSYSLFVEPITGSVSKAETPYTVTTTEEGAIASVMFSANVIASNVSATSLSVSGNVVAGNLVGTLRTAAQPFITSVGQLTGLTVGGNTTINSLTVTNTVAATNLRGTLTTASQPNITSVGTLGSLQVSGNAQVGNVSTNAISATAITASTVSGTLQTAFQPNITSVGVLTSLNVRGNITAGNVSTNVVSASAVTAGNLQSTGKVEAATWFQVGSGGDVWRLRPDTVSGSLAVEKWEGGVWVSKMLIASV